MALTPEDVRNKLFTTVRLREGYEQTEVDEFLDEVEAELMRLRQENDELRTKSGDATAAVSLDKPAPPLPTQTPTLTPARPVPQEIVVRTSGDVSAAAARVLEMAQRTAEQYLGEAREEADKLVSEAQSSAEQVSSEAQATAEKLTADARAKADEVDRETHQRTTALERDLAEQRTTALDGLQAEKRRLESEVETLRSFEREYRGRLRSFLENQLEQFSARDGDTPLAPAGGPVTPRVEETAAQDVLSPEGEDAPEDGAAAGSSDGIAGSSGAAGDASGGAGEQGGRRIRMRGAEPADDGAEGSRPTGSRSALGRILEEEERKADGS